SKDPLCKPYKTKTIRIIQYFIMKEIFIINAKLIHIKIQKAKERVSIDFLPNLSDNLPNGRAVNEATRVKIR
ncbi:unnamed protein product, partial [marine sediment metagenome]